MRIHFARLSGISLLAIFALPVMADFLAPAHPYMLWTKEDQQSIQKRLTEDWAKQRVTELPANTFGRLFRYQMLGDQKAGDEERKYLLSFINSPLDGISDNGGGSGLHTANYLAAMRYDVLYDTLTPQQRAQIEETFRGHIAQDIKTWKTDPAKLGILPNLALPRRCGTLMMSVALGDEKLIRELWDAPGSFRWFIGDYLSDGRFYNEEFAKMSSLMGELLLYARGLDRVGLTELGFGFKGKNGATLERYAGSYIDLGYPETLMPGATPGIQRISMGDTRGGQLLRHFLVEPYFPDGSGGWNEWYSANMNGRDHRGAKVVMLQTPQWFEILAARFPKEEYKFFLACMHKPGENFYYPTLFWGLDPISVKDGKPPEVRSYVADQRGFALLRANETPEYWTSPAPAVAMQLAQFYVHYTNDCFSLLGYQQFNRPIYSNRSISAGYNGGPWDMTNRGECGVVVDQEMVQPIGQTPNRRDFSADVKFVSTRGIPIVPLTGKNEARSSDQPKEAVSRIYSNIDASRSLFLTDRYLFDVFFLRDEQAKPRDFYWLVHAPGSLVEEAGQKWTPSDELQNTLFATQWQGNLDALSPEARRYRLATEGSQGPPWVTISGARQLAVTDGAISVDMLQTYHGADVSKSRFGAEWYARKIGVRVSMLAETGTTAWAFDTPEGYTPGSPRSAANKDERASGAEWGGVSIAVHRHGARTVFAALHEPYENGRANETAFRSIQRTDAGLAVAITGKCADGTAFDDRALLQFDDRDEAVVKLNPELEKDPAAKPMTLEDGQESFTFVGHGFVRITPTEVRISGPVTAIRLRVGESQRRLVVNEKEVAGTQDGNVLVWGSRAEP